MIVFPEINSTWRAVAEAAARTAGRIAVAYRGQVETKSKGLRNVVTEADFLCQAEIKRQISAAFPDHRFLAEETDNTPGGASELCWVIDPIDGTTNYSYGLPVFCTSIALTYRDVPLVGVVYDPLRDEMYAAERGRGATLNGRAIRVSERTALVDALVGLEWASDPPLRLETVRRLDPLATRCMTVRSPGAAALSLAYVAAGALDVYFNVKLSAWDVAAGCLLIEEAGGRVSDLRGGPWSIHGGNYLGSNGAYHAAILDLWRATSLTQ
ncbi:MAG: inositol monophosphatase family protein [Anaerolineae bacterium]